MQSKEYPKMIGLSISGSLVVLFFSLLLHSCVPIFSGGVVEAFLVMPGNGDSTLVKYQCRSSLLKQDNFQRNDDRNRRDVRVFMGLNAKSLMKGKGKKNKGGGKSSSSNGGNKKDSGAPRGNSVIDTNKREYIYQMYRMTKRGWGNHAGQ